MLNNIKIVLTLGLISAILLAINILILKVPHLSWIFCGINIICFCFLFFKLIKEEERSGIKTTNSNLSDNEVEQTLEAVQSAIGQQTSIIETEIERTKVIVKDVVGGISGSFKYLDSLSQKHQYSDQSRKC
jgi:hypothetical protein